MFVKKNEELLKIPIAEICLNYLGYVVDTSKDSKLWRCLISPNGIKILCKTNPEASGDYLFMCLNSHIKGNIINLLMQIHGYKFHEICNQFVDKKYEVKPLEYANFNNKKDTDNTAYIRRFYDEFSNKCTAQNYLTSRGISNEILQFFKIKAAPKTAFFPLFFLKKRKWCTSTGIRYYIDQNNERKRLFFKGLAKSGGYSLLTPQKLPPNCFKSLKIFESPIDALSYAQLFPREREAIYLSFCGGFGAAFKKQLKLIVDHLQINEITICLDNDDSGVQFTAEIQRYVTGVSTAVPVPKLKDWNDDLIFNPLFYDQHNAID